MKDLTDLTNDIVSNFNTRLKNFQNTYDHTFNCKYTREDILIKKKRIMELAVQLQEKNRFYSAFKLICDGIDTMEGMERFLSFLNNFYDDCHFTIIEDDEANGMSIKALTWKAEFLKKDVATVLEKEYTPMYNLMWGGDEDKAITYEELITYLEEELNG